MNKYLITEKSGNSKVGPIMVTTSPRETCPKACPFRADNEGGCYAESYPLGILWTGLDKTEAGAKFNNGRASVAVKSQGDLIAAIKRRKPGELWRHNQAGDLPGKANRIDAKALRAIVDANAAANARGFTYTHKPITATNAKAIADANARGFTVNLSANGLSECDALLALNIGPVATVLPADQLENTQTPNGAKVIVCPAVTHDNVSCATCQLCQRQRDFIVGFPAHGTSKKKADRIACK